MLRDYLTTRLHRKDPLVDRTWKLYIEDHKTEIQGASEIEYLDPDLMARNRYDVKRYLKDSRKYPSHYTWVIYYINDIHHDVTFDDMTMTLLIPSVSYLDTLYQTFVSSQDVIVR